MKRIILTLLIVGGGILSSSAATYIWDGSAWVENSTDPSDKSIYTIDQAYGSSNSRMISSLAAGSWIDFGAEGSVGPANLGGFALQNKKFKFNATLDMNIDQSETAVPVGSFVVETRWLLKGENIYWREGGEGPNYVESFCLGLNGVEMNKLDAISTMGSTWEASTASFEKGVGNYRFITDWNHGIGVQYSRLVTAAVPEPTTAALGLLGLVGLMARRRRTC